MSGSERRDLLNNNPEGERQYSEKQGEIKTNKLREEQQGGKVESKKNKGRKETK